MRHCKTFGSRYARAVKQTLRHVLVWMLAIALIAGGLPIAHAATCGDDPSRDAAMAAHPGHAAADMEAASTPAHDAHRLPDRPSSPDIATVCKCLNCSHLCAAFVAPLQAAVTVARRVGTVAYLSPRTFENDVSPRVDPGIPILA